MQGLQEATPRFEDRHVSFLILVVPKKPEEDDPTSDSEPKHEKKGNKKKKNVLAKVSKKQKTISESENKRG